MHIILYQACLSVFQSVLTKLRRALACPNAFGKEVTGSIPVFSTSFKSPSGDFFFLYFCYIRLLVSKDLGGSSTVAFTEDSSGHKWRGLFICNASFTYHHYRAIPFFDPFGLHTSYLKPYQSLILLTLPHGI